MDFTCYLKLVMTGFAIIAVLILAKRLADFLSELLKNPFEFPCFARALDVRICTAAEINSRLNNYLLNGGFSEIAKHAETIEKWKRSAEPRISEDADFRDVRRRQYDEAVDEGTAFRILYRSARGECMVAYSYKELKSKYDALRRNSDILNIGTRRFKP